MSALLYKVPSDQHHVSLLSIALKIARQHRDPNAQIQCCSSDGCNWSWETAASNQAIGALTSSDSTESVATTYIGVAVAIFAIILLCLLGCFIYYWWSNKQDEDEDYEDRVVKDSFYGRQRSNFNYSNFSGYESRPDSRASLGRSLGRGVSTPSTVTSQPRR